MRIAEEKLASFRDDDQFLVSYPRSGNTWMRYLLLEVIQLGKPEIPRPPHQGMLVPDIHINAFDHAEKQVFGLPTRLFKSHISAM